MANASLLGMPLELLVHLIATYLPTQDLGALRLTCKYLDKALFDIFAKEFFTKRQFMLTSPSLSVLVAISKHEYFSRYLSHVIIGLDSYDIHQQQPPDGKEKRKIYRNGCADYFALRASGRARDMLAEAFRNLPNLATLGIRDYQAVGRVRDNTRWKSYGASTVQRETGIALHNSSPDYASEVYITLLQAQVDACKTIPSLEVIIRRDQNALHDYAFYVRPNDIGVQTVLGGLQSLLLTVCNTSRPTFFPIKYDANDVPEMLPLLLTHLSYAKNLKHLRLNQVFSNSDSAVWIARSLVITPDILPALQTLELGKACIRPGLLLDLIHRFATSLKDLCLWGIHLYPDTGTHWQDSEDRYHPWPILLSMLTTVPNLELESLAVGRLSHSEDKHGLSIHWKHVGSASTAMVGCKGDMKAEIPKLIASFAADWPPHPDSDDDSDDNDDDVDAAMPDLV